MKLNYLNMTQIVIFIRVIAFLIPQKMGLILLKTIEKKNSEIKIYPYVKISVIIRDMILILNKALAYAKLKIRWKLFMK